MTKSLYTNQTAQQFYADEALENKFLELYAQLDAHISELEDEKPGSHLSEWRSSIPTAAEVTASPLSPSSSTIFDDVDD